MKKRWNRLLSGLLAAGMLCSLLSGAALAVETKTTKFPEYYTQSGDPLQGTDNVALGLKMSDEEIEQKIEALLHTMTLDEKYTYLGGNGTGTKYGNAGYLPGTPRLGVPETRMHDGPSGVLSLWPTTNTPDRQLAAATWDDELLYAYGKVYGSENRAAGANMQLGAQFDITRTPEFGRANDQLGEDPYLLGRLAAQETKGMQDQGVIAVGKHYAAFAQSASPAAKTDIDVSEQALHELYLPAFEAAVKEGGMLGLMSSYNSINGTFASAQEYLQLNVLRELWGYKGFTVTDWGGNDGFTLDKGTDIEMPSLSNNSKAQGDKKVAAGELTQEELDKLVDEAVGHVLYALGKTGYLYLVETYQENGKLYAKAEPNRTEPIKLWGDSAEMAEAVQAENNEAVLEIARGGGVLLENDGTLPIASGKSVAVLGTGGKYTLSGTGGERSYGVGYEMTSPYESLKEILGGGKVSLEPVFDNGGEAIPAANLFVKDAKGNYTQGFTVKKNEDAAKTVTGKSIEYLPAENSFEGGTALNGSSEKPDTYTWTTYLKVDKTGGYTLVLQGLGGTLSGNVTEVAEGDTPPAAPVAPVVEEEKEDSGSAFGWTTGSSSSDDLSVSYSNSQGAHWHSGDYCTDTGMSISSGHTVKLEAGKYYKVEITGIANRDEKDMQLRLAWLTPDTSAVYNEETGKLSGGAYDHAMSLAASADVTVVFVDAKSQDTPKTRDADNLNISAQQERLVLDAAAAAHKAGKKIAVVINNETAITIHNWVDQVDAVLMMYRPGQKGGQATAELLTGKVNPSGKLAYTMPIEGNQTLITYTEEAWNKQNNPVKSDTVISADMLCALNDGELERYWRRVNMDLQIRLQMTFEDVSGFRAALAEGAEKRDQIAEIVNNKVNSGTISHYDEGILTGYRWYDSVGLEPRYDFGYGLSYTTFAYSNLSVKENKNGEKAGYDVTFTVKNTGSVTGSEVAQLYLGQADTSKLPEGIQSAPYQLAGYTKIKDLKPGERKTVTLHVDERALSYWNQTIEDEHADKWTLAEGSRTIYVGAASNDLKLSKTINVGQSSSGK